MSRGFCGMYLPLTRCPSRWLGFVSQRAFMLSYSGYRVYHVIPADAAHLSVIIADHGNGRPHGLQGLLMSWLRLLDQRNNWHFIMVFESNTNWKAIKLRHIAMVCGDIDWLIHFKQQWQSKQKCGELRTLMSERLGLQFSCFLKSANTYRTPSSHIYWMYLPTLRFMKSGLMMVRCVGSWPSVCCRFRCVWMCCFLILWLGTSDWSCEGRSMEDGTGSVGPDHNHIFRPKRLRLCVNILGIFVEAFRWQLIVRRYFRLG